MSLFYGKSYWVGLISSATLNLAKAPDFPAPLYPLEGEGTQASPYLIKNYNDLCQVQETVNSDNNFNYTLTTETDTIHYSRPYLGKYLKLMADIDMTGYDFTPIATAHTTSPAISTATDTPSRVSMSMQAKAMRPCSAWSTRRVV